MTKKHIIIGIIIIIAIIVIWKFVMNKSLSKKIAQQQSIYGSYGALLKSKNCSALKQATINLEPMLSDSVLNSSTDSDLTDVVYFVYTDLHNSGLGTDVVLNGQLSRADKISALKNFLLLFQQTSSNCI